MQETLKLNIKNDLKSIIVPILVAQLAIASNLMFFHFSGTVGLFYYLTFQIFFIDNPKVLFSFLLASFFSTVFYTADLGFYAFIGESLNTATASDLTNSSVLLMLISSIKNGFLKFPSHKISILLLLFASYIILDTFLFAKYSDSRTNSLRLINFYLLFLISYSAIIQIDSLTYIFKFMVYITFLNIIFLILFTLFNSSGTEYHGGSPLIIALPIVISLYHYQIITKSIIIPRILFIILILLACYLLLLENSRRMFIVCIFYIGYILNKNFSARTIILNLVIMIFITLFWFEGTFDFLMPENIVERLSFTREALNYYETKGEFGDYSGQFYNYRDKLTEYALEIFKDNPLFGIGFMGADSYLEEYSGQKSRIHNFYLQILADIGLIGMLIYLLILFQIIKLSIKKVFGNENLIVKKLFGGFIIYVIVSNLISYLGMNLFYAKTEWFIYGMILGYNKLKPK